MNVLIFGGTGKTGKLVVERALTQSHTVTVLVRDPIKFKILNVRVITGNATNPSDVLAAMHGQQAVIETIGGTTPWKSVTLETDAIHAIIQAMQEESVPRLISVSMMGIGDSRAQAPFWYRSLLMPTFLHGSTQDKTNKEVAITAEHVDYVIVRPRRPSQLPRRPTHHRRQPQPRRNRSQHLTQDFNETGCPIRTRLLRTGGE